MLSPDGCKLKLGAAGRGWVWLVRVHFWKNADSRNHGEGGRTDKEEKAGLMGVVCPGGVVVVLGLRLAL